MAACELANESVILAKTTTNARVIASKSLSEVLEETARIVNRRVLWVMEAMAFIALIFCLALVPMVRGEGAQSAMGLAAGYFTLSGLLGAYLLLRGKNRDA